MAHCDKSGTTYIGTATDGLRVEPDGTVTFFGTGKKLLSMRPVFLQGRSLTKPSIVELGVVRGYSLPIYANDQELFFNEYTSGRWDQESDIVFSIIGYLSSAETVGKSFKLQMTWTNKETSSGVLSEITNDINVITTIPTGRNAQNSIYKVDFIIDWDAEGVNITNEDFFAGRIRRLAVGGGYTEMSGEFVVTAVIITYVVNKIYKEPSG